MRDSVSSGIAALAVVLCCALPVLILSGVFVTGTGLLFNQQTLQAVGITLVVLVVLGGLSWFLLRRKSR